MRKVYFVRHGESESNAADVFGGFEDVRLTEKGRTQAVEAGKRIKQLPENIDLIIASPLKRTHETALIVADELGLSYDRIESDRRIIEIDDGLMKDKKRTPENRAERDRNALTQNNKMKVEYVGDMAKRLRSFVKDLWQRQEETILIVGHGFSGRMLTRVLNDIEITKPIPQLANAEVEQIYPYVEPEGEHNKFL